MCGIFGMISKKSRTFNKRAFCTFGVDNDSRGGDSCGIFIDGNVEYGVDNKKYFLSFFKTSPLLTKTKECSVALGHCRKASIGKISIETAQPVVIKNNKDEVEFVLIHNGTIYDYKELAQKYIPEVDITGMTDSQVMARIFYYAGYDSLKEYNGGAVFVIHDYRINKSYVFKGSSKKYSNSKIIEEERPLYYCWHNGRFCFSSIYKTLAAFYYDETVKTLPANQLLSIEKVDLQVIETYDRSECCQAKKVDYSYLNTYSTGNYNTNYNANYSFQIQFDGLLYTDLMGNPLHGVFQATGGGLIYPYRKYKDTWLTSLGFFNGRLLRHPDAYKLIENIYIKEGKKLTPKVSTLINMLDFNPHTDDLYQFYWYEDYTLMIPQGEWKFPFVDWSYVFNKEGIIEEFGTRKYFGWQIDYKMYVYDEKKILENLEKLCEGE